MNTLAESVKNCLALAGDRQDQLTKDLNAYKEYEELLADVSKFVLNNAQTKEETATNIPALKTLISTLEAKLVLIQAEQVKLKNLQDKAKKVEQRADVASRQTIQEGYSSVAKQWREMQDGLTRRCSELNDLVDTWEVNRTWGKQKRTN